MSDLIERMTHTERANAILSLAISDATKRHTAASGSLIRQRVESCLTTALAMCKEDALEMYKRIDEARVHDGHTE